MPDQVHSSRQPTCQRAPASVQIDKLMTESTPVRTSQCADHGQAYPMQIIRARAHVWVYHLRFNCGVACRRDGSRYLSFSSNAGTQEGGEKQKDDMKSARSKKVHSIFFAQIVFASPSISGTRCKSASFLPSTTNILQTDACFSYSSGVFCKELSQRLQNLIR